MPVYRSAEWKVWFGCQNEPELYALIEYCEYYRSGIPLPFLAVIWDAIFESSARGQYIKDDIMKWYGLGYDTIVILEDEEIEIVIIENQELFDHMFANFIEYLKLGKCGKVYLR